MVRVFLPNPESRIPSPDSRLLPLTTHYSLARYRRQHIRIARKPPLSIFLFENRKCWAGPRHRVAAVRRSRNDCELSPHESPVAEHLHFLDLACAVELRCVTLRLRLGR